MTVFKRPNGRWRAQVKHRGVVVADQTFDRKKDAERWEAEQKRSLQSGTFVSPAAGRLTVRELAAEYVDYRRHRVALRTWESDVTQLTVHIVPTLGDRPVSSVSSVQLARLLSSVASSRAVRTTAKVRVTLRGLFGYAVASRRIATSPAADLDLPRPDGQGRQPARIRPFTRAELLSVVAAQRELTAKSGHARYARRYADVTLVLGLTGLRMGELRGLRVGDVVEVPYPAVVVQRSCPQSAQSGQIIERTTTKSGRSRLVPLVSEARAVVGEWTEGRSADELLFPSPEGGFLRAGNWRRTVHWSQTSMGRRPHDLRHTAATQWLMAGVDVKTVAAWLGHASTKLTLDTYGHWMGTDADRAALARLEAVLRDQDADSAGHPRDTRSDDEDDADNPATAGVSV